MYKYISITCFSFAFAVLSISIFIAIVLKTALIIKLLPILIVGAVLLSGIGLLISIKPTWNSLKKGDKVWRDQNNQSNTPTSHGS